MTKPPLKDKMLNDKPPVEPKAEEFGLSEEDLSNYSKFKKQEEDLGFGCTIILCAFLAITAFGVSTVLAFIVVGILGGDELYVYAISLIVASYVFVKNIVKNGPDKKIEIPNSLIEAHSKFELAKHKYRHDLSDYNYKQKDYWFLMSGHRFEREFGRLLEIDGYKVKYTKGSGDGGIDLIAKKASEEIIIQCKAWKNPVGPAPIREMQGVKEGNQEVWVVGLGGFTTGAKKFAKQKGIRLLEYKDINLLVQKSNR